MKKLAILLTMIYGIAFAVPATSADNSEGTPKVIMVKPSPKQAQPTTTSSKKPATSKHKSGKSSKSKKHSKTKKSKKHKSKKSHT